MTKTEKPASAAPAAPVNASLEQFEAAVAAVVKTGLKSKTAMVRIIKPALEEMNQVGFTQEQLVAVMVKAGLDMTLGQLKTILWRENQKTKG